MSLSIPWDGLPFLRPLWLLALIPVALLWWRWWHSSAIDKTDWAGVVDAHLRPLVLQPPSDRRRNELALLLALLLGCLALSGPAMRHGAGEIAFRSSAARVLVVDMSPAMDATDWTPPRSERARLKLLALLQALPDGQTALLVYGAEPYLLAPLTMDSATISLLVPELSPAIMPLAGDQPLPALLMASGILKRSAATRRDLIWITGRSQWSDEPVGTLDMSGVTVSILHAAARESAALRRFAERSGGQYQMFGADDTDVRGLTEMLARQPAWLAASAHTGENLRDLGPWFLLLILPLAAWALRGYSLLGLCCALPLMALPAPADAAESAWAQDSATERQAYRLFQDGKHDEAGHLFSDARWQAAAWYRAGRFPEAAKAWAGLSDADAHYNRGNALARSGDLRGALAAYEEALLLQPNDADAIHNRDLVRDLLRQAGRPEGRAPEKQPAPPSAQNPPRSASSASAHEREAEVLAEQLRRRIPDAPAGLVQRKLALEHQRRQAMRDGQR